jgi:hypothetical protein
MSFADLMKIPKRIRQNVKHPRKKPPSFELTSPEHFSFIGNKTKEQNVRGSKKAKKSKGAEVSKRSEKAKKSKEAGVSKRSEKVVDKIKGSGKRKIGKKSTAKLSNSLAATGNDDCLVCGDSGSKPREQWVRCVTCLRWAHSSCAGINSKDKTYVCDFCG